MASLTFTYTNDDDNQIWLKGTDAAGQLWSPVISGIPSGAIINSVTLSFACGNTYAAPGESRIYWGTSTSGTQIWSVSGSNSGNTDTVSLKSYITGNMTANLYFYKTANSSSSQSNVYFSSVKIIVNYIIPYTACTAPTSITVSPTTAAPDGSATLSWSDATAGTSNAITGYHIYRSDSADGTYSKLSEISTTDTSGSTTVTAPSVNGDAYYYKIYTIGTVSGYDSDISTVYATLTCKYSAPSAPTNVRISKCISTGENVILTWDAGNAGTNNPIAGYHIYYRDSSDGINWGNETLYASVGNVTSYSVSPPAAGYYRKYIVYSIGTVSGSNSSGTVCYNSMYYYDGEFTDDPLVSGETHIKAVHITELQELVAIIYNCYQITLPEFTDIIAGETSIGGWSQHVEEIREAFDGIQPTHDTWITIVENKPTVTVMQQLRNIIIGSTDHEGSTTAKLGQAILGIMKLGND